MGRMAVMAAAMACWAGGAAAQEATGPTKGDESQITSVRSELANAEREIELLEGELDAALARVATLEERRELMVGGAQGCSEAMRVLRPMIISLRVGASEADQETYSYQLQELSAACETR